MKLAAFLDGIAGNGEFTMAMLAEELTVGDAIRLVLDIFQDEGPYILVWDETGTTAIIQPKEA